LAFDLEQRQFALNRWPFNSQIMHFVHDDHAFQLGLDLGNHLRCARGHNRDARTVAKMVNFGHGQAVDIVATGREQADDAGQNARFIVNADGKGVCLYHFGIRVAQVICGMLGRAFFDL